MADLKLYANTETNVDLQPITAGQMLFTTDLTHNKQYVDKDATTRVEIGGMGMDLITSEIDFNAQTASTDKALDSFVLKEILDATDIGTVINDGSSNPIATTNLIDTLTGIVSNTTANQVAGALAVKTIEDRFTYSTTEKVIGTWIDGKPLYQKTIDCGALPNNTSKNVAHGISNLKYVLYWGGGAVNPTSSDRVPMPMVSTATNVSLTVNPANLIISAATDRSAFTLSWVTIRYTKVTD